MAPTVPTEQSPNPLAHVAGRAGAANPHHHHAWNDPTTDLDPTDCGRRRRRTVLRAGPLKPTEATLVWNDFLGEGRYSDLHHRTGVPDPDRIVSADGTRSIRIGAHEMNSSATKFRFHDETWTFDATTNTWTTDNLAVRGPCFAEIELDPYEL